MSVLIKCMKMPRGCDECDFVQHGIGDWCYITEQGLPCDCPLIELPDHGRLIDADALINKWRESLGITEEDRGAVFVGYTQIPSLVNSMPTVIGEDRSK